MGFSPEWEQNGQQTVSPNQQHHELGQFRKNTTWEDDWEAVGVGNELLASGRHRKADKVVEVEEDGKKALDGNQHTAGVVQILRA